MHPNTTYLSMQISCIIFQLHRNEMMLYFAPIKDAFGFLFFHFIAFMYSMSLSIFPVNTSSDYHYLSDREHHMNGIIKEVVGLLLWI